MDTKAIGARIKAAREAAQLSQEALAEKVDLSRTHMSVIERGVKMPRLETFVIIANALGVSADTLLFDVVDQATLSVASELSVKLANLPREERQRILKVLDVLLASE